MGSVITLGLGRLEVDWGKNWRYSNHSKLFLADDRKPLPYYYVDADTGQPITESKVGFARVLRSVRRRLVVSDFYSCATPPTVSGGSISTSSALAEAFAGSPIRQAVASSAARSRRLRCSL
jgi:hypothetical protein